MRFMEKTLYKLILIGSICTITVLLFFYMIASFGDNKLGPLFGLSIFYLYFFIMIIVATILAAIVYFVISKKIVKIFVILGTACALLSFFGFILFFTGDRQNTIFPFYCAQALLLGLVAIWVGYKYFVKV